MAKEMTPEELVKKWIEIVWGTGNADSHECNTRFDDKRNLNNCISTYTDDMLSDLTSVIRGKLIEFEEMQWFKTFGKRLSFDDNRTAIIEGINKFLAENGLNNNPQTTER